MTKWVVSMNLGWKKVPNQRIMRQAGTLLSCEIRGAVFFKRRPNIRREESQSNPLKEGGGAICRYTGLGERKCQKPL